MKLPILYKRTRTGAIQYWEIETQVLADNTAMIVKTSGQYGTDKPLEHTKAVTKGKNLGRANQTSPQQQAESEATSDWKKKQDEGYKTLEDLGITWDDQHDNWVHKNQHYWRMDQVLEAALPQYNTDSSGNAKPMLAQSVKWNKVTYPCFVQPKLDGCVYGNTLISTDQGLLKIKDIVENKLPVRVLSYNEAKKTFEHKQVVNWFNNGESRYTDWLDITLPTGQRLKTTANHKYLTDKGWKEAKDLNQKEDLIYVNSFSAYRSSLLFGTILGDTTLHVDKRVSATSYRLSFSHTNKELFDYKISLLNIEGSTVEYMTGYGSKGYRFVSKALSKTDFPVDKVYFVGHSEKVGQRKFIPYDTMRNFMGKEALSLWIADDGSLRLNNSNPFTPVLSISVHRHSVEQVDVFVDYFTKVWNCTPTKIIDKRVNTLECSGLFLNFNTKDTLFLLNHLKKLHCKGVEYKYYFPTEGYLSRANDEFKWSSFHKANAKNCSTPYTKYDLEVEDNHNYVANGIVIHNCRTLLVYSGTDVTFLSRTGKEYTTLDHIKEEAISKLPEPVILDGEIYSHELTFQEIVAAVKKQREDSLKLKFRVYDVVNDMKQVDREVIVRTLTSTINWETIHALPTMTCHSQEEIEHLHQHYVSEGYEGVMIRLLDGTYDQGQRSSNLLKVKEYDTNEFAFINFELGQRGVEDLIAVCSAKCTDGVWHETFKAKMQGTVAQKQELYSNQPAQMSLLTVKHHGYTDDGFPRFPIGVNFRDYE